MKFCWARETLPVCIDELPSIYYLSIYISKEKVIHQPEVVMGGRDDCLINLKTGDID